VDLSSESKDRANYFLGGGPMLHYCTVLPHYGIRTVPVNSWSRVLPVNLFGGTDPGKITGKMYRTVKFMVKSMFDDDTKKKSSADFEGKTQESLQLFPTL
jgi:hypothetical protein